MSRRTGNLADQERGSWFVNFLMKCFFAVMLITVFLSLIQCSIKSPESPSWDTNLTVPLIQRTYTMTELVEKIDGDYLRVDSNGAVLFEISETLDTVRVDAAEFQTSNISQSVNQTLGNVTVVPPALSPVVVPVADIGPLAVVLPGNVPAMDFVVAADIPSSTSYTSMTIGQGSAWLIIENNLGIDLSTVTVDLNDNGASQLIGTFNFPSGIASAARDSVAVNLNGRTLSNQLGMLADCHTSGGSVLSAADKGITTEFRFDNSLTVSSATTTVPSLSRSVTSTASLNEPQVIQQAELSGGNLSVSITNGTNLAATIQITIPDLKQGGNALVVTQNVAPQSTNNQTINLANAVLEIADQTAPQQLPIDLQVTSAGSGSNLINVNANDGFSCDVELSNLSFATVTGTLDITTVIDPTSIDVDIPQGFENGSLAEAVLLLSITNRFGVAGDYSLQLNANNGKQLTFSGTIAAANGQTAVTSTSVDSSVANFLSPLPTNITITGTANFGDGSTIGTISSGDFVVGVARFSAPLALTLGPTLIDFDVERAESDGLADASADIQQAEIVYTVNNHLPVGATLEIHLGADSASLLNNPDVNIDGITLAPGTLTGGIVTAASTTGELRITLDRSEIDVLKNNPLYILPVLTLPGTSGQVVRFTGSDYVTLIARAEITYRFDGSF